MPCFNRAAQGHRLCIYEILLTGTIYFCHKTCYFLNVVICTKVWNSTDFWYNEYLVICEINMRWNVHQQRDNHAVFVHFYPFFLTCCHLVSWRYHISFLKFQSSGSGRPEHGVIVQASFSLYFQVPFSLLDTTLTFITALESLSTMGSLLSYQTVRTSVLHSTTRGRHHHGDHFRKSNTNTWNTIRSCRDLKKR